MGDVLILAGAVLPSSTGPLHQGWGVAIAGGTIVELGPNRQLLERHPGATAIRAHDLLILPGFVDAHLHAYGVLAHGMPVPTAPSGFRDFLEQFWWPLIEDRLDQDMIRAAVTLTCANLIRAGVTSVCDVLEAPLAPSGVLDLEAQALAEAGLRGVLSLEASERYGAEVGRRALEENARFVQTCRGEKRVRGMLSLHTTFTCSADFVLAVKERASRLGCDIHLHLSESPYEPSACLARYGVRPVEWYERLGFWDTSVLASQVVAVTGDEIHTLAERGVRVAHTPLSNCEVGGGIAPVPSMISNGIRPGLGTDGYIVDMFEVMRGAFLVHKAVSQDPRVMAADVVLAMATRWGAEAIGLSGFGELALGRPADLIGVSMEFDTPLTSANATDQVVLRGNVGQVRLAMVDGQLLMKEGELLHMDLDRLRHRVLEQARRLWSVG